MKARIGRLEYDDHYVDFAIGCRLPHDDILDDPGQLAALSGPCVTVVPAREADDGKTEESVTDA